PISLGVLKRIHQAGRVGAEELSGGAGHGRDRPARRREAPQPRPLRGVQGVEATRLAPGRKEDVAQHERRRLVAVAERHLPDPGALLLFAAASAGQAVGWNSSGAAPKSESPVFGTSGSLESRTEDRSGASATTWSP